MAKATSTSHTISQLAQVFDAAKSQTGNRKGKGANGSTQPNSRPALIEHGPVQQDTDANTFTLHVVLSMDEVNCRTQNADDVVIAESVLFNKEKVHLLLSQNDWDACIKLLKKNGSDSEKLSTLMFDFHMSNEGIMQVNACAENFKGDQLCQTFNVITERASAPKPSPAAHRENMTRAWVPLVSRLLG